MKSAPRSRNTRSSSSLPMLRGRDRGIAGVLALLIWSGAGLTVVSAAGGQNQTLRPCPASSPMVADARRELAALGQRIEAIADANQLAAAQRDLRLLLQTPCLAISAESRGSFDTKSVVAFKAWWRDGGRVWVESYLNADAGGRLKNLTLPPDVRDSLIPDDASGSPASPALAGLLCPAKDASCGSESRGFRVRADAFFVSSTDVRLEPCRPGAPPPVETEPCRAEARAGDFARWRNCVHQARPLVPALPWGDLRSPRGGWLSTLRSSDGYRSGDKEVCKRTRRYHIDSGSTYIITSCRPVDADKTAKPRQSVQGGRSSVALVREALWMLLLEPRVTWRQVAAHVEPVPATLRVQRNSVTIPDISGCLVGPSAHAPDIGWSWGEQDKLRGAGRLRLRNPGEVYAVQLLNALEATFEPGQPTESLPPGLQVGGP
jgi:hypothetical protein